MFSFHLLVEEMTITLDNASCLLHLLVTDRPIDHLPSLFDREAVKVLLMIHLGISIDRDYSDNKRKCLGGVKRYVMSVSYVWDVRAYLLHLIISMIFGDKSLTHVHVAYLLFLNNLTACHEYT
ncbi:hypothetical protein GmHk_18G052089 [Glycine max]|nr:hypothetical protein GmHk_18G052089 [Glycine max]